MTQDNIEVKKKEFANEIIIPEIIAMLNSGHSVTLGLRGYSMRPFLEDRRDKALLRKPTAITVGDVVLAEISAQTICPTPHYQHQWRQYNTTWRRQSEHRALQAREHTWHS